MRHVFPPAAVAVLGLMPSAAQCDEAPLIAANREIGIGPSGYWLYYREFNPTAVQDSEHGWIPGFNFTAKILDDEFGVTNLYASVTYHFETGYSHHSSLKLSPNPILPAPAGQDDYLAGFTSSDVTAEVGKALLNSDSLMLVPVIELQYRNWLRTIPQALLAIQEDYTFFAPGGAIRATFATNSLYAITGKVGVEYTLMPRNATVGNGADHVPNFTLALAEKPVYQLGLGADYLVLAPWHIYVNMEYEHFGFGMSEVKTFGRGGTEVEPTSQTDQVYFDVGLAWSF